MRRREESLGKEGLIPKKIYIVEQDDIDKMVIPYVKNTILIKLANVHITESGIIKVANESINGEINAVRFGEVIYAADKVYFNPKKESESLHWNGDITVRKGDLAWFNYNANFIMPIFRVIDGNKTIDYIQVHLRDVYAIKRRTKTITAPIDNKYLHISDHIDGYSENGLPAVMDGEHFYELISMPEYILCEPINMKIQTGLLLPDVHKDMRYVKAVFIGDRVEYLSKIYSDPSREIENGDIIVQRRADIYYLLEDESYLHYNKDKVYVIVRKRNCAAIIKQDYFDEVFVESFIS